MFIFLYRCIYCFAQRPQDTTAKFCNECGNNLPKVPNFKLIPPEKGQVCI